MKPKFFAKQADFRAWLETHHETAAELPVGFFKKASGKPSITWPEAVDEALCFGWIDGVRRSIDEQRYVIRFTPRSARSNWSDVNLRRGRELVEAGLMRPAGLRAFEQRDDVAARYSYEQRRSSELEPDAAHALQRNERAWRFFESQPPAYRRAAVFWVVAAKKDATRRSRLATLIADSEHGRKVKPLRRPGEN